MRLAATASRMITGRRKTIRLVRVLVRVALRNRPPTSGRSPSSGTLVLFSVNLSSMRPPSTRIAPSSTTTVDSIERLSVDGPALLVPGATLSLTLDDSWKIVMRIVPPSPICGLMRSVMPTSLRSIVWNGLVVAVPVLVNWPVTKGTLLPTMIFASSLSSVIRFGVETMLVLVWLCSSRATAASA